jgi:hypothetical protein
MVKKRAPRHLADARGAGNAGLDDRAHPNPKRGESKQPFADHAAQGDAFDLRGTTPETWACIDCGINTFPGYPTRVEMERRCNTLAAIKTLSATGEEPVVASLTVDDRCEVYMVRNAVWRAAGIEPMDGCICIGCLEKRLGRALRPRDFSRRHPFNCLPGTDRLIERREGP